MPVRLARPLLVVCTTLAIMLLGLAAVPPATAVGSPWIQSDLADYPPGATVTLTAGGFDADEAVHLNVNDDQGKTWTYDADVTADGSGAFTNAFTLPNWFVATYAVSATGASGNATTTFTDANVDVSIAPTGVSASVKVEKFNQSNTCGGTPNTTSTSTFTSAPASAGGGNSIRLTANATDTSGTRTFVSWTVNGGTPTAGASVCVVPTTNNDTAVATYSAPPPSNHAPVAVNDSYSVAEDNPLTPAAPGVLTNDTDVDAGTTLTAALVAGGGPAHAASFSLNANGSFSYTPVANFNGSDSFTYRASDGSLNSNVATVSITVTPVNDAPVAVDDAYSLAEDGTLTQPVPGVLGNDTDVDASPALTAVLGAGPTHGSVTLNPNGSFSYSPNANFNGSDTFTYRASDGSLTSGLATVTLTVNAVNDAPVAVANSYSVNEDGTLSPVAPGVLGNDTDADSGTTLSAVLVGNVSHGTLTLNANGSFSYSPNANFHGADSFTYKANDGSLDSNVVTASITVDAVNDPPVADDDSATTAEDTAVVVDVLDGDTDLDGDTLSVLPGSLSATHGTATLITDGSADDGKVRFTPAANFNGSASFTYTVRDGHGGTDDGDVTITVTPVNDAPVAADDSYSVDEDSTLTRTAAGGVLTNDSDIDSASIAAVLVDGPSQGDLILNPNGSFTYTPDADFNGADSFTYRADDGSLDSNLATVSITVNAVNDAPVAVNDSYSVDEDGVLTRAALTGVLANDSDVDSSITAVLGTGPSHGILSFNPNGSFTYTPAANYNRPDSFTYQANDGSLDSGPATVSITVNAVNDAPTADDQEVTTDEDTSYDVTLTGGDVDGDALAFYVTSLPGHGVLLDGTHQITGTDLMFGGYLTGNPVTYAPNLNYHGDDAFGFATYDGVAASGEATVSITVVSVNDDPVAQNDSASVDEDDSVPVDVLANDADVDGDTVSVSSATDGAHGTTHVNLDGTVTYTPAPNFNGADSFTYDVSDGAGGAGSATVNVTVDPVNDAPVAVDDSATTAEDTAKSGSVAGNDSDVDDGDTLLFTLVSVATNGTASVGPLGGYSYSPDANFYGTDSFTYQVCDDDSTTGDPVTPLCDTATVTITVTPVNDAPVAGDDDISTPEDTAKSGSVAGNDSDVETGDTLTWSLVGDGSHGTATVGPLGGYSYTPNANFYGTDSFTYRVCDDGSTTPEADNLCDTATVSVTVTPVNDAPTAGDDSASTPEDTAKSGSLAGNDSDVDDGDTLLFTLVSVATNGTASVGPLGGYSYSPDANFYGTDSFTYQVCDDDSTTGDPVTPLCDTATMTITVDPVNDAPVAVDDSATTAEDTTKSGSVAGDASDVDTGDSLSFTLGAGASHGTASVGPLGGYSYSPDANFYGTDSFIYEVCDDDSTTGDPVTPLCDTATVTITVTPVNDAPVAGDDSASTAEDTAKSGSLAADASDVDTVDTLTFSLATGAGHGVAAVGPAGGYSYTPDLNFNGADSFTYQVCDNDHSTGDPVTPLCATAMVSITVTPVNDAPVVVAGSASGNEGSAISVGTTFSDVDGAAPYSVTVNWGDGKPNSTFTASGSAISATHTYDDNGVYSAVFTVTDSGTTNGVADPKSGSGTVSVTVANVAPTVAAPSVTVNPVTGTVTLSTTFTDPANAADQNYTGSFALNGTTVPGTVNQGGMSMSGTTTLAAGCYALNATAAVTDNDGGTGHSAATTTASTDVYAASFLAPIRDDMRNITKYGNVVPVKVQLASRCSPGTTVNSVPLFLTIVQGDQTLDDTVDDSSTVIAESVSNADSGTQMRTADGKYIYNLATKQFTAGKDYTIRVRTGSATGPIILRALFQPKK